MSIHIGDDKTIIFYENVPVGKIRVGEKLVYPSGSTVTYYVDVDSIYTEEMDSGSSCLSPETFTPTKTDWTFVGWRKDKTASSDVLETLIMEDSPVVLYAVFRQSVTVTYYNGNTTKQTTSGYKYYNNSNIVNPKFTIGQAGLSGWTARGWSTSTAGDGSISYNALSNTEIASSVTLYGMYYQTITLTLYNGSATASKPTGTRYYNSGSNAIINPTFTVAAASVGTGWTFRGWSTSTAGDGSISYNALSNTEIASSVTLYGMYYQTITLTLYNGSATASKPTGTRYYNSGSNAIINPTFTVAAASVGTGWTFRGWSTSSAGNGTISYNALSNTAFSANATLYALYYMTITLSYTANGGSGTAPITQSGYRYYSSLGTYVNPSFTVASNTFSRSGYSFAYWRLNGTSGTAYNPGSSVTITTSSVMYADWTYVGSPYYIVQSYTCKTALSWTTTAVDNINPNTGWVGRKINWTVNQAYPEVGADLLDDQSKTGSISFQSDAIDTKGNKTMECSFNASSRGDIITVNGQAFTSNFTVDISNVSSIVIYVTCRAYAYNKPVFQPINLRLY